MASLRVIVRLVQRRIMLRIDYRRGRNRRNRARMAAKVARIVAVRAMQ
jgi:hypothetical protein